jgi:hypothetical protein
MVRKSTARQDALNDAFRLYGDDPAKLADFIAWINASHKQWHSEEVK